MTQRLFWAFEQLYGSRELHMFKSLEARNAWVNQANGLSCGMISYRGFPVAKDFDDAFTITAHGDAGEIVSRTFF